MKHEKKTATYVAGAIEDRHDGRVYDGRIETEVGIAPGDLKWAGRGDMGEISLWNNGYSRMTAAEAESWCCKGRADVGGHCGILVP